MTALPQITNIVVEMIVFVPCKVSAPAWERAIVAIRFGSSSLYITFVDASLLTLENRGTVRGVETVAATEGITIGQHEF